jgi:hypothetical protein
MAVKAASNEVTLIDVPPPAGAEDATAAGDGVDDDEQPVTIAATATMDTASFLVLNNSSSPLYVFR